MHWACTRACTAYTHCHTLPHPPISSAMSNLVVLIGGGHAAGKKTTAHHIKAELQRLPDLAGVHIEVLDMRRYMDPSIVTTLDCSKTSAITTGQKHVLSLKPSRFDFAAIRSHLCLQPAGRRLIIVHGLYALYDKQVCNMSQIKVYIDSDADTRLIRWIKRDVLGSGEGSAASEPSSLESVVNSYLHGARQEMADYIAMTKERADVIMPRGYEANGVSLIVDGILPLIGAKVPYEPLPVNTLRPFQNEHYDQEKGEFYDLT